MFIKDWKKDVFTIPNLISMIRLALIPVYIYIYLNATQTRDYYIAGGILVVSCLTDMIDGQIARKFHMTSTLGKLLDPIADKLTQLALIVCLSIQYPLLRISLLLLLCKELFQAIAASSMFCRGKALPGAILPGKICTTVLFLSFIVMVLIPEMDLWIANTIATVDAIFLAYAFISYIFAFFGENSKVEDFEG